ncbi:amidohydrolase [Microbacterium sp. Au-Mic1]|uniref:amidohydrolase n=1 Tax=Microbacterium sp. Au-Mic1 TaxID=2906457 RepID=UPI001E2EF97D|nr:amidohydrolase [Microbacterium sp. Au-Mic1]MCE4025827.1 amidohydrolase [Microbacterium sp. Au-Mic1]
MTTPSLTAARDDLRASVEAHRDVLLDLSHAIHADPELGGDEFRAAERVREALREAGFAFDGAQPEQPTAFAATAGTGDFVVAVCVEYDALPEIGHGCGHNVNAASAVGAALALAPLADELDITVLVLGTPAEESWGGKIDLIDAGFFDGAAIAMMAHASGEDNVGASSLALGCWDMTFHGRGAHAAAAPTEGVNALDAIVIAQTATALARQQLPNDIVMSSIVVDGGTAPNVIPARATARVELRAPRKEQLDALWDRVRRCYEAGALATGCSLTIEPVGHAFADLRQDAGLSRAYADALVGIGRRIEVDGPAVGSTDMGNVSHIVPSIHPMIGFEVAGAVHHTAEFAAACATAEADAAILDAAYGMAAAAAAVASAPDERARLLARAGR